MLLIKAKIGRILTKINTQYIWTDNLIKQMLFKYQINKDKNNKRLMIALSGNII